MHSLDALTGLMYVVAITVESYAGAALEVLRVQQIAQGQRPHAVGTQKSVVSPARFVAVGWVVFRRISHGLLAQFVVTMG